MEKLRSLVPGFVGLLIAAGIGTMIFICYATLETALAAEKLAEMPSDAGIHDLSFETESGDQIRYSLYLPAQTPRDGTQALALVLHYGGPASGFYGRPLIEQLVQPALATLDALMVAPVTLSGDWSNPDNERAVFELLAMVERTYTTDPARRLITGYSMGGSGTWSFTAQQSGHFSAAIPISGFRAVAPSSCKTPIYALHSRADSIFDADQLQALIDAVVSAGGDARVDFIDGVDHYDIPAFAPLLERTVPWLRRIWEREP